jgi:outer membrane protein assembly factor BamD
VTSRLLLLLLLGLLLAPSGACTAFETNLQDTEVSYQETARQNYESGETAFEKEQYNEAIKFFEHVKNKFPYSKYAVLADLRIADAHFEREKWLEAADAYRLFVRFHPRHEQVAYATFRIAKAYFEEMGEDIFILPPSREKDQRATQDAIRAFDDYLSRFPAGEHLEEARTLRTEARTKLADHDLYAAEFYAQRHKWKGALWRYEHIAREFSDTPLAPMALLRAARIQQEELDAPDEAKVLYERLLKEYPDSEEASEAKSEVGATG